MARRAETRAPASAAPLYARLTETLAGRIRRGELAPGAPFLSERELNEQYGVSSITSRRVMAELVREGLIERRNGVGTFVRASAPPRRLALLIFEFQEPPLPSHRQPPSAFGELVGGVAQVAWEERAAFSLAYLREPDALAAWLDAARTAGGAESADGVLVRTVGDLEPAHLDLLEGAGIPFVLVRRHVPGREAPCALIHDRGAVRLSTEHLLGLGHRRIGFVVPTQSLVSHEERLAGYREALAAHGVPFAAELVVPVPDYGAESGEAGAAALLSRAGGERPSALMMASDSLAVGAYEAAAQLGLRIPEDVSVAGVADIPEAVVLRPALTTARTSYAELGARATRLLLDQIDARWRGEPLPSRTELVAPSLIVRASTAPPLTPTLPRARHRPPVRRRRLRLRGPLRRGAGA